MFINYALATNNEQWINCPMCQWMMNFGGPFWGWLMFFGMTLISLLTIIVLVLLIIWLIKQINKK